MEELLETFPSLSAQERVYKSFIFQPERISLCSNDDVSPNTAVAAKASLADDPNTHRPAETFSSWRIRLQKPLRGVKSLQLLSACVPNPVLNIPDNQTIFYYYLLQSLAASSSIWSAAVVYQKGSIVTYGGSYYASLTANNLNNQPNISLSWASCGADGTRPNYFQMDSTHIGIVCLIPTTYAPPEFLGNQNLYNRQFQDYDDLVATLNAAAAAAVVATPQNSVTFVFNQLLNRLQLVPQNLYNSATNPNGYYYIPCGYEDPNIDTFYNQNFPINLKQGYKRGYTLNSRLGFVWNGNFTPPLQANPYLVSSSLPNQVWNYMRPTDPIFAAPYNQNIITAQATPDLVYSGTCRIFADIVLGSSEDSTGQGGLLSVVPMNATTNGIAFYQSAFNNPLTKVPDTIPELEIRLQTDAGDPFYLPNSATVTLELAITYK